MISRTLKERPLVERALVISTAHITAADAKILESGQEIIYCEDYGHGFHIPVTLIESEIQDEFAPSGLSLALSEIYRLAIRYGFDAIRLDSGGPVYTDIPTFDW